MSSLYRQIFSFEYSTFYPFSIAFMASSPLFFITSSKDKFNELRALLPDLEQLDLSLPEIQEMDAHIIIKDKLAEALKHTQGPCIVEDTSLYCNALSGLPGPLAKWFDKTLGFARLAQIVEMLGDTRAEIKTLIGYATEPDNVRFFEGNLSGNFVSPRGNNGFGWDPIFQPEGLAKTFGEMTVEEKNNMSTRAVAFKKLREFLAAKH